MGALTLDCRGPGCDEVVRANSKPVDSLRNYSRYFPETQNEEAIQRGKDPAKTTSELMEGTVVFCLDHIINDIASWNTI